MPASLTDDSSQHRPPNDVMRFNASASEDATSSTIGGSKKEPLPLLKPSFARVSFRGKPVVTWWWWWLFSERKNVKIYHRSPRSVRDGSSSFCGFPPPLQGDVAWLLLFCRLISGGQNPDIILSRNED